MTGWQLIVNIAVAVVLYLASGFDDIKQGAKDAVDGKEYSYELLLLVPCV